MDWRLTGLALALVAGLADIVGGTIVGGWLRPTGRGLTYLLGLAGGFMLAAAILGRLPEAMVATPAAPLLVVVGYLTIFACENLFSTHAHQGEEPAGHEHEHDDHSHVLVGDRPCPEEVAISGPASMAALVGLLIHTFFDGVAIAAGFLVSNWLGTAIFIAIFLHKLPEGFTVASLMLASGRTRRAALFASVLLGAATLAGVLVTDALRARVSYALPLSGGVTLYVAASDLMPEVNREPNWRTAALVFAGLAMLFILQRLFNV
jgi:zinc transporter ZupT